ncbi:MAG: tetratricopeptide repeat protein [Gammaproteobacteria bacterium]
MAATHESTISALSLTAVGVVALAVVMLLLDSELDYRPLQVSRVQQAVTWPAQSRPPEGQQDDARMAEIRLRFQQAVMMLHAGRYEHAATALHRVLALSPRLTAAHVNMGYAMLGLKRLPEAESFFRTAIDLDPYQGNAYWGLAEVFEQRGDLEAALGAMRTYIHLAPPGDPYVRRARAALWEWDTRLARGPQSPEERRSLEEKRRQWEDRNSPRRDTPATAGREIVVQSIE